MRTLGMLFFSSEKLIFQNCLANAIEQTGFDRIPCFKVAQLNYCGVKVRGA